MSSLLIEKWARQAVMLERRGDDSPVAHSRIMADVNALRDLHRTTWRRRQRDIDESGELQALQGVYAGLSSYPPAGALPVATSISGDVLLWAASPWSAIAANSILAPQAARIVAMGLQTTAATPANQTITPRIGTLVTSPTLGATGAVALTASITASFWKIVGDITFRTAGAPGGTNYTAYGFFHFISTQGTSAGLAGPAAVGTGMNLLFGGTSGAFDGSLGSGIVFTATHTVTTVTYTPQSVHFAFWN